MLVSVDVRPQRAVVRCLAPEAFRAAWMAALRAHAQWPTGLSVVDGGGAAGGEDGDEAPWLTVLWDAPASLASPALVVDATSTADVDWANAASAWRAAMDAAGDRYVVLPVSDLSAAVDMAVSAVVHAWARAQQAPQSGRWRWVCADCDDADCERHDRRQRAP